MADLTRDLHRYEQKYRLGDLRGLAASRATVVRLGAPDVFVVAPHSVAHRRDGSEKAHEFYTGGLAELVAERLGWSCVAALRTYDDRAVDQPVASVVGRLVDGARHAVIVELHGMAAREVDVCVGTCGLEVSRPLADALTAELGRSFATTVDQPFAGASSLGAALAAERSSLTPLHLELGTRLRADTVGENDLNEFIGSLGAVVERAREVDGGS